MEWIYVKDKLPPLGFSRVNPNYGRYKQSPRVLVGTENGGIYIGYLEVYKSLDQESDKWIYTWYTASVQENDIDTDGVQIVNVIAWCKIPDAPTKQKSK